MYVFHFWVELVHLVEAAFGNTAALKQLVTSIGYKVTSVTALNETIIMLVVLALIDVVMISNLLIMVIVGAMRLLCRACTWKSTPTSPNG